MDGIFYRGALRSFEDYNGIRTTERGRKQPHEKFKDDMYCLRKRFPFLADKPEAKSMTLRNYAEYLEMGGVERPEELRHILTDASIEVRGK